MNYALSNADGGPPEPFAFHVGNLVIHIAAGLTLFGIVRRTLRTQRLSARVDANANAVAGAIALLWLVHPLQTAAVTYLVQRAESLMGLFLLLTLYCAIRASEKNSERWSTAAVAACALGMASKETMVVAPLIVLAWDWFFASDDSPRALWTRRWPLYAGLAATWIVLVMLVSSHPRGNSVSFGADEWPWWRYLATQAGVILHYLRLVFVPRPLVLDYGWLPVAAGAAALPAVLVVAALVVLTALAIWRRHPAGFAGAVFFFVLAPTSSVLPIITEVAAEHRMYAPLAAVLALVVCAVVSYGRRVRIPSAVGGAVLLGASVVLGWMTHERNEDYTSEERIWADTLEKRPENPRARINYGVLLLEQRRVAEAEPHLRRAVALDPADSDARLALGAALCSTGRCDEGVTHLRRASEIDPEDANIVRNLAEALASRGERREAATAFRRAVDLSPNDVFLLNQASWLLATAPEDDVRDGRTALMMAERAVSLTGRRDPTSLDSLAVAYAELGRFAEAERAITDAIAAAEREGQPSLAAEFRQHRARITARQRVR